MSVVVKGLNLENKHLDGYVDVRIHYCNGNIYATIQTGERPFYKRLEVVELHDKNGKLGDLDATASEIEIFFAREIKRLGFIGYSQADRETQLYLDGIINALAIVKDAPAIVEAEDSELAKNSPKVDSDFGDLISRAAAQTELMMKCERYTLARESHGMGHVEWSDELIDLSDAMDAIRDLPSVQPEKRTEERTETHACDLISRQAAIEARCNTWN